MYIILLMIQSKFRFYKYKKCDVFVTIYACIYTHLLGIGKWITFYIEEKTEKDLH